MGCWQNTRRICIKITSRGRAIYQIFECSANIPSGLSCLYKAIESCGLLFLYNKGVFTWRKLAPARVSHWDDILISYRVYMMTGSFHADKIHVCFNIANITLALPQCTGRPFSHRNGWSFRVSWYRCEISYRPGSEILAPLREPGWTHVGGTHVGVTRAGITFCGGIM